MKIVYKLELDGYMDSNIKKYIEDDGYECDGVFSFYAFASAKKALVAYLRAVKSEIDFSLRQARKLKEQEVETGRNGAY